MLISDLISKTHHPHQRRRASRTPPRGAPASGNSTLVMLVVMLVERVFLVSGVVKTLFSPNKKKERKVFLFSPRTKKSKADFVGVSKSPLFATETQRIYSRTWWNYFFYSVKTFFIEVVPCIFLMAGENSKRVVEVVPCIFFKWREKILSVSWRESWV